MIFSHLDWHNRYLMQSHWTRDVRQYLYKRIDIGSINSILDVGCGSGVLEAELAQITRAVVVAIDLERPILQLATQNSPSTRYAQADGHYLPIATSSFDLVICHFLLLWVERPHQVLTEMARIARPGGVVMAIAEPDYGGRIDYPFELEQLGVWQVKSLQAQGANPLIGRRLQALFKQAGFSQIETGVLGGQWSAEMETQDRQAEWEMLEYDLSQLGADQVDRTKLRSLKNLDEKACRNGERLLFVPTFYAWGRTATATTYSPS